jgi:hypothetical protein
MREVLGMTGRRRQEEVGPRRVDCAREGCANDDGLRDPWYVHASQVRTIKGYAGDCASCAARGRTCVGYLTPMQALIEDEPPIPDEATTTAEGDPGLDSRNPLIAGSDSHATTSPSESPGYLPSKPEPTAAEIAARLT